MNFDLLKRMDEVIKGCQEKKIATLYINSAQEGEELMRLLIARNAYSAINYEKMWTSQTGFCFCVTVMWD